MNLRDGRWRVSVAILSSQQLIHRPALHPANDVPAGYIDPRWHSGPHKVKRIPAEQIRMIRRGIDVTGADADNALIGENLDDGHVVFGQHNRAAFMDVRAVGRFVSQARGPDVGDLDRFAGDTG